MKVKICGIKTPGELDILRKEKVDMAGFIVGVTHKSEDALRLAEAKELIRQYMSRVRGP